MNVRGSLIKPQTKRQYQTFKILGSEIERAVLMSYTQSLTFFCSWVLSVKHFKVAYTMQTTIL